MPRRISIGLVLDCELFLYAFDLLFYLGDATELQVRVVFKSMFTAALNLPSIAFWHSADCLLTMRVNYS